MYAPGYSMQRLAELQVPGTGRRVADGGWRVVGGGWQMVGGGWWVAGGGWHTVAEIITSVDIIV